MAEVALSLSGGGFRAAMFHLGTLHYLHNLRYKNGHSFLEDVHTISTISGGTLTGLWYMMSYCEGRDINEAIEDLYKKMVNSSLPDIAISNLLKDSRFNSSLIREMVIAYDRVFFDNKKFDIIWNRIDKGPIHHFCAGGTDFGNGLPYRFQVTREIKNAEKKEYSRGFVGNKIHKLDETIARQIKLSEIMAVSSCFPGAFEPMEFPNDFSFSTEVENKDFVDKCSAFGIMDGGIVDNQGVEALKLANTHLIFDEPKANIKGVTNFEYLCHDLVIISDVANPYIPQEKPTELRICKNMSLLGLTLILLLFMLCDIGVVLYGIMCSHWYIMVVGVVLTALVEPLFFMSLLLDGILLHSIKKAPFKVPLLRIMKLRFSKIWTLLDNRICSLKSLAINVFMKHIRKMQYNTVYGDEKWKNRLISNNLSELSSTGSWRWKKDFPEYLKPSEKMIANTDVVANMSSTLWFTSKHLRDGYPQSLFASGQYTICMNLLEYIEKVKKIEENKRTEFQTNVLSLEATLLKDWKAFTIEPHCKMFDL